jgi:asparagine synthase (glutamine-hydrolysing)
MCGITGVYYFREPGRPINPALLDAMTDSLAHRGPDGRGTWTEPGVGLGHRRLAIIETSEAGLQPMVDAADETVITFNGEIYNFRELREILEGLGYPSRTRTDTEVILLGYRAWGVDVLRRLSGIFAFALWDRRRRRLFLARDPLGVKPLFYSEVNGVFRFASEIKGILSDPAVGRDVDNVALDAYLTLGYTPAPATGFAAVRQLEPGYCALVDEGGSRAWSYWSIPYRERPDPTPFPEAVEQFTTTLDRITAAQLVADVPVGAFLSGGLDSAAIVRAMQRATGAVESLTVGFDTTSFDERPAARRVAERLGVPFSSQEATLEAVDLLPRLSQHMEEPTADSSMLPVYLLCREARRRFTVAMSGDGADEILAGYVTYGATALARRYRMLPAVVRRLVALGARQLPVCDRKYSMRQKAMRFVEGAELGPGRDHAAWRQLFSESLKARVYSEPFRRVTAGGDPLSAYAARIAAPPPTREPLTGLLHADTTFYLPNDMLVKVDRMSMAHGLEVRVPFLDIELVSLVANLPAAYKLHRGRVRKHILRESLRGSIPDDVLDAPKSGFNVPLEAWMRGRLGDLLVDSAATRRDDLRSLLRLDAVEVMLQEHRQRRADHAHALFAVLMLALWFDNRARAWRHIPSPARIGL